MEHAAAVAEEHIERLSFAPGAPYNAAEATIHTARYLLAKDHCAGRRVLDVSCGEGYGAWLMATWGAAHVDAVDLSAEAIAQARATFASPNVTWHQHDAERLGELFEPATFDLIVSLETIEHLPHPAEFVAQLRRLLKPDGVAIISCPNDHWYYRDGVSSNPYHLRQFTFEEFKAIIDEHLDPGCLFQLGVPVAGYGNFAAEAIGAGGDTMAEATKTRVDARRAIQLTVPPPGPIAPSVSSYFVAIRWPGHAEAPTTASVHPQSMDDWDRLPAEVRRVERMVVERDGYIKELESKVDEYSTAIRKMDGMLAERVAYIKTLEARVDEYGDAIRRMDQMIRERDTYIKQLENRVNSGSGRKG